MSTILDFKKFALTLKLSTRMSDEIKNRSISSFQSFIRACLAYRKEERIDVFGLARHEYLQPPMPKPRGAGAPAAAAAAPAAFSAASAHMFGAGSSS